METNTIFEALGGFPAFATRYAYSASRNSFYEVAELDLYVEAGTAPQDLVEVADSVFEEFTQGPYPEGKTREAGPEGMPIWVDVPPPSEEEMAARHFAQRDAYLDEAAIRIAPLQDAVDLGMATADEVAELTAWKRYRVELNRLATAPGFPFDFQWPEVPV